MPAHSFALIPAAYILLLRPCPQGGTDQVLLQLRQHTGYMDGHWACGAAGHVEDGESVVATALRELGEELGVSAGPTALEPLTAMHRSNDPGGAPREQRVDFFFTLRSWSGAPRIQEPGKTAALQWFALDRLPEPTPPHERRVLGLLAAHLGGGAALPAVMTMGFEPGERIDHDDRPLPP